MAEYVKLRLTAAKVGVSMAFLAVLAGLADKARAVPIIGSQQAPVQSRADISSGGAGRITIQKLDTALIKLEHKLATSFDTTHKLNTTFLKIRSANTEFLKIRSANTTFIKIEDANANFLKIDAANAEFLKVDAANGEFLKLDSTAANSNRLGGLTPQDFFHGTGNVVSGAASLSAGESAQLLGLPGGIIVVRGQVNSDGVLSLTIHNGTAASLPAVQDLNGTVTALSPGLATNADTVIVLDGSAIQLHLQIFPNGSAFPDVVTLIVSAEHPPGAPAQVVGQAFAGAA